ncbi:hypothetical protein OCHUTO_0841 [Orientia chuto str. Dubai]|uniref:Uncharacterized protein n=1 Tax=Orientia chuto str. Dubai TaxID=1359168 RepID=A0A0F3MIF8_9RICK|nr:hypothetical protein [Candidatus Orientia mediorientalis]KJV55446.1 hypothetical protein OCHUTO_0841 [Orientia chuto str. Dubai]
MQSIHYKIIANLNEKIQAQRADVKLLQQWEILMLLEDGMYSPLGDEGVKQAKKIMAKRADSSPTSQLAFNAIDNLKISLTNLEAALVDPMNMSEESKRLLKQDLKNTINIILGLQNSNIQDEIDIRQLIYKLKFKVKNLADDNTKYYPTSTIAINIECGILSNLALGLNFYCQQMPGFVSVKAGKIIDFKLLAKLQLYKSNKILIAIQPVFAFKFDTKLEAKQQFNELHLLAAYIYRLHSIKLIHIVELGGATEFGNQSLNDYIIRWNTSCIAEFKNGFKIMVQRNYYIYQNNNQDTIIRDQASIAQSIYSNKKYELELLFQFGIFIERYRGYKGLNGKGLVAGLWIKN